MRDSSLKLSVSLLSFLPNVVQHSVVGAAWRALYSRAIHSRLPRDLAVSRGRDADSGGERLNASSALTFTICGRKPHFLITLISKEHVLSF